MKELKHFFCFNSIVPVRAEAKDQAEIVTQLLFGEIGEIISFDTPWMKVKSYHDGYEGYIDFKQIISIDEKQFKELSRRKSRQISLIQTIQSSFGPIKTVKGSFLEEGNYTLEVNQHKFTPEYTAKLINRKNSIGEVALEYINAPYLWGGRTTFGIDCSGFTQAVLRFFGVELLRDASQQVKQGEEITFSEARIGDLAFFKNKKGSITHVGIILENNKIIHASGRVKVEEINKNGIYSEELEEQTHVLANIRRYLK